MRTVYLDNAATTKPYDIVVGYVNKINNNIYGNASSLHMMGIESERVVRMARTKIASILGVEQKEITFTSGGTEANNLAILGYLRRNRRKGMHIITTQIEHPSVLEVFRHLEANEGYEVDYIEVDRKGYISIEQLKSRLNSETAMVSIMHVNNETGTVQNIDKISRIIKSVNENCVFHVDAVQSFGKFLLKPKNAYIDMLSLSSHKIHGIKGCGVLYVNKGINMMPIMFGGGQENNLRSGTENVSAIGAFGKASEKIYANLSHNFESIKKINNYFREKIEETDLDYDFISYREASPYILTIAFANLKSEVLLHHLEQEGIYVSNGSACSSKSKNYSHVLTAMKIEKNYIDGVIRFSFSEFNNQDEIDYVVEKIEKIVKKIKIKRGVSN